MQRLADLPFGGCSGRGDLAPLLDRKTGRQLGQLVLAMHNRHSSVANELEPAILLVAAYMRRVVEQLQAVVEFIRLGIVVAVVIDDRDGPARARDPGHLGDRRTDVAEVVCRQTRTDEIEVARGEWYILRPGLAGFNWDVPLRRELPRNGEHVRRRVDQDDPSGTTGERQSEVPRTAADVADSFNRLLGQQRVEPVNGRASLMDRARGVVLAVRVEAGSRARGCGHAFSVANVDSLYDWEYRWTSLPASASLN